MGDGKHAHLDMNSDETHMHAMEPSLTDLKLMLVSQMQVSSLANEEDSNKGIDIGERQTFVSHDGHSKATGGLLLDCFCIGLK